MNIRKNMLNREKHELIMTQILKDIFTNTEIAPLLGFKGGTAAYFFYGLPRFSVDLDFDLLENNEIFRKNIFEKIERILSEYGTIKDSQQKENTIFFLLSYGVGEYGIKIEVNTRSTGASYEIKQYFGIPVLVMKKESMLSAKLIALTQRRKFAARDLYDVYYFFKQNWDIDENVLSQYGENDVKKYLQKSIDFVKNISDNRLLEGLGELIDNKEKDFVRNKLKDEVIFLLHIRENQYKK